jgi:hypothetical protein
LQQEKTALQGSNLFSINMSGLPPGSYTLTAKTEDGIRSLKLIRQ